MLYRCTSGNIMVYPVWRVLYQRPQTKELPADLRRDYGLFAAKICFKSQPYKTDLVPIVIVVSAIHELSTYAATRFAINLPAPAAIIRWYLRR
jgi:hypothetical protein